MSIQNTDPSLLYATANMF